ncbi:hypothetical protein [Halomicronema sp. CCY15110]|uniref:hypothetical protein n=1 Tax=Halomicronema sp. CCY15110 TaxID=2767773 RepID=UPI001951A9CF|nr:hypothetical protein [Halomicronema sp. CCY15110]
MSTPKHSPESGKKKGNPNWTEKDPTPKHDDTPQEERTEQGEYGDRNPNWTEKDVPFRRSGS